MEKLVLLVFCLVLTSSHTVRGNEDWNSDLDTAESNDWHRIKDEGDYEKNNDEQQGYFNFHTSLKEPEVHEVTKIVPVHKTIKVPVTHKVLKPIHIPVPVKVLDPYPIKIPVPVVQEKIVHVPVEKVVEYKVEKPVPVKVVKKIPVPVPKPYPVKVPVYKTKYIYHSKKSHHE